MIGSRAESGAGGFPSRRLGRLTLLLGALAIAASGSAAAPPAPRHIMSMDMCDDLMLLMLVPKDRIASITYLAHPAVAALMPGADAGVAINHGTAEEILRQKPDLILASAWSTPLARRLAKQVGAPLVEMDTANSFADIRRVMRRAGSLVGERARADALIARMDAELARLDATRPARPARVVVWGGGGSVPGRGTLTDAIITRAGATNIAAKFADDRYSSFGLEELLAARPDAVLQAGGAYDAPSLHQGIARHPLVARLFAGRQIDYPGALYTCGLPQSAIAAAQLRAGLAALPPGAVRW